MEPLQFTELFCAQSDVLHLPALIGLFCYIDQSDCVYTRHTLPQQDFNLLQLHDTLFGFGFFFAIYGSPVSQLSAQTTFFGGAGSIVTIVWFLLGL